MKTLEHGHALSAKLLEGVRKLAAAVGPTLGPRGRNVLIREEGKQPFITKDGATVASYFSLEDPVENAAADVVKQASRRTNIEAGDGTTTSTILAAAIYEESLGVLRDNENLSPVQLQRSLQDLGAIVLEAALTKVREVDSLEDIRHVATISANNDPGIGELITRATEAVGSAGSITIEDSNTSETTLDLIEGFRFDSGYASSSFITDPRRRSMKFEEPLFLITDSKLDSIEQILPSLEIAARESRPFIIVADEIEGQALAALIMNAVRGNMKVAAIKSPGYGNVRREVMEDLAASVGAKYFQKVNGDKLRNVTLNDFGAAKSIRSTSTETTIVGGSGDPDLISEKIAALQEAVEKLSFSEAEDQVARLVRLQSGVAVIRVGGDSEVEVIEVRHRVEDALEATRSAQSEGIVAGGGSTLLACSKMLKETEGLLTLSGSAPNPGLTVLSTAFEAPIKIMAKNSGVEWEDVSTSFSEDEDGVFVGYDFLNLRTTNLFESGIIDPYRVTRCCIKNAISVAGSLLTTSVSIIDS